MNLQTLQNMQAKAASNMMALPNTLTSNFLDKQLVGHMQRLSERTKGSKTMHIIYETMIGNDQDGVANNYPELDLTFKCTNTTSHSYSAASRSCETVILLLRVGAFSNSRRILDIGGNWYYHCSRGLKWKHCCTPPLDMRDSSRTIERVLKTKTLLCKPNLLPEQREAMEGVLRGIDAVEKDPTNTEPLMPYACFNKAEDCNFQTEYGISVHSIYDIKADQWWKIFESHGLVLVVGTFHYHPNMLLHKKGMLCGGRLEYEIDVEKDTVKFHFVGDGCFGYAHSWSNYFQYTKSCIIQPSDPTKFAIFYEHCENRDGVQFFKMTRVPQIAGRTNQLTSRQWFDRGAEKVVVSVYKHNYSTADVLSLNNLDKVNLVVNKAFIEQLMAYAIGSKSERFTREDLNNYARSAAARTIVNGELAKSTREASPDEVFMIVSTIFVRVQALKQEQELVTCALLKNAEKMRALCGSSLREIVKTAFSDTLADWICGFFGTTTDINSSVLLPEHRLNNVGDIRKFLLSCTRASKFLTAIHEAPLYVTFDQFYTENYDDAGPIIHIDVDYRNPIEDSTEGTFTPVAASFDTSVQAPPAQRIVRFSAGDHQVTQAVNAEEAITSTPLTAVQGIAGELVNHANSTNNVNFSGMRVVGSAGDALSYDQMISMYAENIGTLEKWKAAVGKLDAESAMQITNDSDKPFTIHSLKFLNEVTDGVITNAIQRCDHLRFITSRDDKELYSAIVNGCGTNCDVAYKDMGYETDEDHRVFKGKSLFAFVACDGSNVETAHLVQSLTEGVELEGSEHSLVIVKMRIGISVVDDLLVNNVLVEKFECVISYRVADTNCLDESVYLVAWKLRGADTNVDNPTHLLCSFNAIAVDRVHNLNLAFDRLGINGEVVHRLLSSGLTRVKLSECPEAVEYVRYNDAESDNARSNARRNYAMMVHEDKFNAIKFNAAGGSDSLVFFERTDKINAEGLRLYRCKHYQFKCDAFNHELVFDGKDFLAPEYDGDRNMYVKSEAKYVLGTKHLALLQSDRISESLKKYVNSYVSTNKVTLVEGVPGCGKTTEIIQRAKPGDLILTVTRDTRTEIAEKLAAMNKIVEARTVDSLLINGAQKCYYRVFLDEGLLVHPGVAKFVATITGCVELLVYGDRNQLTFINRLTDFELKYPVLREFDKVEYRNVSYRVPIDIATLHNQTYTKTCGKARAFMTTSQHRRSTSVHEFGHVRQLLLNRAGWKTLVFTQAEKAQLTALGFKNVSTIGESQGTTYKNVQLIRVSAVVNGVYSKQDQLLVATTRHTHLFEYWTIRKNDTLSLMLKDLHPDANLQANNYVAKVDYEEDDQVRESASDWKLNTFSYEEAMDLVPAILPVDNSDDVDEALNAVIEVPVFEVNYDDTTFADPVVEAEVVQPVEPEVVVPVVKKPSKKNKAPCFVAVDSRMDVQTASEAQPSDVDYADDIFYRLFCFIDAFILNNVFSKWADKQAYWIFAGLNAPDDWMVSEDLELGTDEELFPGNFTLVTTAYDELERERLRGIEHKKRLDEEKAAEIRKVAVEAPQVYEPLVRRVFKFTTPGANIVRKHGDKLWRNKVFIDYKAKLFKFVNAFFVFWVILVMLALSVSFVRSLFKDDPIAELSNFRSPFNMHAVSIQHYFVRFGSSISLAIVALCSLFYNSVLAAFAYTLYLAVQYALALLHVWVNNKSVSWTVMLGVFNVFVKLFVIAQLRGIAFYLMTWPDFMQYALNDCGWFVRVLVKGILVSVRSMLLGS